MASTASRQRRHSRAAVFWIGILSLSYIAVCAQGAAPTDLIASRVLGEGLVSHESTAAFTVIHGPGLTIGEFRLTARSVEVHHFNETHVGLRTPGGQDESVSGAFEETASAFSNATMRVSPRAGTPASILIGPHGGGPFLFRAIHEGDFEGGYVDQVQAHDGHPFASSGNWLNEPKNTSVSVSNVIRIRLGGSGSVHYSGNFTVLVYGAWLNVSSSAKNASFETGHNQTSPATGLYLDRHQSARVLLSNASLAYSLTGSDATVLTRNLRTKVTGNTTLHHANGTIRGTIGNYSLANSTAVAANAGYEWSGNNGTIQLWNAVAEHVTGSGVVMSADRTVAATDPTNSEAQFIQPAGLRTPSRTLMGGVLVTTLVLVGLSILLAKPVVIMWTEHQFRNDPLQWQMPLNVKLAKHFQSGSLRAERQGRIRKAARLAGYAISLVSDDPDLFLMRAIYRKKLGRFRAALSDHEKAHELYRVWPEEAEFAHNAFEAAKAAARSAEPEIGLYWLQVALTANPDLTQGASREPDLIRLRGMPGFRWMIEGHAPARFYDGTPSMN